MDQGKVPLKRKTTRIKPIWSAINKRNRAPGRFSIEGHPGLYLRVRDSGSRYWEVRSDAGGKRRYKTLGKVDDIDFDEAREAVRDISRAGKRGVNPIDADRIAAEALQAQQSKEEAERADRERQDALRPTVSTIAKKYLGVYVSEKKRAAGNKRTKAEDERLYRVHIEPKLGPTKLEDLKTSMVAAMRDGIESPSERRKAVAVLRALLSHAVSDGLTETNPAIGVKTGVAATRNRVLSDTEIGAIWNATEVEGVRAPMLAAMKVQLLTAQRAGEVLAMRWTDLDEPVQQWIIPESVAKNGCPHAVPLAKQTASLINAQTTDDDYVFSAHRAKGAVSSAAFAQVVARVRTQLALPHFTSHDLRRTAATRMAENLKVLPHVVEAVLNHRSGIVSGVAAVYIVTSYSVEKREALDAWANEVEKIALATKKVSIA